MESRFDGKWFILFTNVVYTPNDPKNDWLFAKMWLGNADFGFFQAITHYGLAHLSTEPIVMATNRRLPPNHPVYKLLKPHFKYHLGNSCTTYEPYN